MPNSIVHLRRGVEEPVPLDRTRERHAHRDGDVTVLGSPRRQSPAAHPSGRVWTGRSPGGQRRRCALDESTPGTRPMRLPGAPPRFPRADHVRLPSRIIASVPLDLAGENGVGQLSLNDDADLSAWVIVNWKHRSGHDRDPAEGQLRVLDSGGRGAAENLARDGHWCGGFRGRVLGKRNRRALPSTTG